jgi:uncharacterized protein YacL (UPF0231 family)
MGKNIDKVIKSSQDIHCDKCGKYLFTIDEVVKLGSALTYEERENDKEDYRYFDIEDIFVCSDCLQG